MPFRSIDVLADPQGFRDLEALGVRMIPLVVKGREWVSGQILSDVARIAGIEYGRKVGERPYGQDGRETATWMVLDFVDVVVHIFDPPHREYYDLELLWGDAPRVEWALSKTA